MTCQFLTIVCCRARRSRPRTGDAQKL